jgi:hypothetical protein
MRVSVSDVFSGLIKELSRKVLRLNLAKNMKEARKEANCIVEVELAICSMKLLYPNEKKIEAIPFLFYSNVLPSIIKKSKVEQHILANVQSLLPHWKVKRLVNQKISQYIELKEIGLHVSFTNELFDWNNLTHKNRKQEYVNVLNNYLGLKDRSIQVLENKESEFWSNSTNRFEKIPIPIHLKTFYVSKELDLGHVENRDDITIPVSQLLFTAKEMDDLRREKELPAMHWYDRMKPLEFNEVTDEIKKVEILNFGGTQHWVGPLSVGKSSLIEVATYYMVKTRKEKVTIIVKDIQEMLTLIDRFDELGINAIPIMSPRNRKNHVKQYLQSIDEEEKVGNGLDIFQKKSFKYLTFGCPLTNEGSLGKVIQDSPPCETLVDPDTRENTSKISYKICPFINKCSYHRVNDDLDNAEVFISNMQSILTQRVPVSRTSKDILFLEYILRKSSLIFIDESDRCQHVTDEKFIPNESLKDDLGGWLTKITDEVKSVVRENPSIQWHNPDIRDWLTSLKQAEYAESEIRYLLENSSTKKNIKSFIDSKSFTGKQLLNKLAIQLVSIKKDDGSFEWLVERKNNENKEKYNKYLNLINLFFGFYDTYKDDGSEKQIKQNPIQNQLYNITENSDFTQRKVLLESFLDKLITEKGLVCGDFTQLVNRFSFALFVCYFEKRLYLLTELYSHVKEFLEIGKTTTSGSFFYNLPKDYRGVVPINPVGTQFGFRYEYQEDDGKQGGELQIFRYLGIGRYIINHFSELFSNLDGEKGAHTILLSATSYAPLSPKYHIEVPVQYIISKKGQRQAKVKYEFVKTTKVSGKRNGARFSALEEQIQFLLRNNYLENILDKSPEGRQRALLITGSYQEALHCLEAFKNTSFFQERRVFVLVSGNQKQDEKWKEFYIERQNVSSFASKGLKTVLIAPLLSLERGHNILTNVNGEKVAAFSNLFYLVRPFPRPRDLLGMANLLNAYALSAYKDSRHQNESLYEEMMEIKRKAYIIQREYFQQNCGYRSLGKLRDGLLMDTNTNCSQIEGRLFRGIEPQDANVFFLDDSFSPLCAEGKKDTFKTSMLEGWKEILNRPMDKPVDEEIMRILYGFRIDGLMNMKR